MGLSHFEYQPLLKGIAKKKTMYESGINPRHADSATAAHGCDALTKRLATAAFKFQVCHHSSQRAPLGFKSHRIDSGINAPAGRIVDNNFSRIDLVEIDWEDIICFTRTQAGTDGGRP